jgi:fructoselysine-6-P-deglycase FrlB-like protein
MGAEIGTMPAVVRDQRRLLADPLDALVEELRERAVRRLVLTGCGDSAFAGQAMQLCLARHTGAEVRAVHALDLCRYEPGVLDAASAVICVSYSGKVGRTIEAAARARELGALTIGLTASDATPLAGAVERVLPLPVPTEGLSPGTSTYVAMLASLAELAARWGGSETLRPALDEVAALAERTLRACAEPARAVGRSLAGQRWVCLVGGGPNVASARFGAAKLIESAQVLGTAQNIEEWAHQEYFVTEPGTPVIVVGPDGASADRARDLLAELEGLGARAIVVGEDDAADLPIAAGLPEELTPLLAALPLSLLAFALAELTGKRSYNFRSSEAERRHYETIHRPGAETPA